MHHSANQYNTSFGLQTRGLHKRDQSSKQHNNLCFLVDELLGFARWRPNIRVSR